MTRGEITGITFHDLDPSETQISRSSELSIVNSIAITLNIPHGTHIFTRIDYVMFCLSLTFVRRTQGLKLWAVFLHCCVPWLSSNLRAKFYGDRPRGTPPSGR